MISAFKYKLENKVNAKKPESLHKINAKVQFNQIILKNKKFKLSQNKRRKKKTSLISVKNVLSKEVSANNNIRIMDIKINANDKNENGINNSILNKSKKNLKHRFKKSKLKKKKKNKSIQNIENYNIINEENIVDSFLINQNESKELDANFLNVETYQPITDLVFVFFKEEDSISFSGKAQLKCLVGSIEVLGKLFDKTLKAQPIYAPLCHPRIIISNKSGVNHSKKIKILRKQLAKYCGDLAPTEVTNILNKLNDEISSVFMLSKLESQFVDFISSFKTFQNLFNKPKSPKFNLYPLSNTEIIFPSERTEYIDLLSDKQIRGTNQIILLCGGKGSGKSTFCRYIANRFLNNCEEVMLLDCDVGQTEFQPPGFVGLNKIHNPLIGPGFTHPNEGLVNCFVGGVSPAFDPLHYLNCVKFVFKTYTDNYHNLPLLINTMGWTRDIGVSLLLHTIELVKPTVVIQLESCSQKDNLPPITAYFINNPPKDIFIIENLKLKPILDFEHYIFPSVLQWMQGKNELIKISAKDFRDLMFFSHFFGTSNSEDTAVPHSSESVNLSIPHSAIAEKTSLIHSLAADDTEGWMPLVPLSLSPKTRVLQIHLKDIALHVMHENIPPSLILAATNAAFCSFAFIDSHLIINSELDGYPNFLEKNPICESLGIGIIRSFDMKERCLYVSTCAKMKSIVKTNCLLVGGIQLPKQLLITDENSIAIDVDYVSYPRDGFGVAPLKSKGLVIARKRPYDFAN